MSSDNASTGRPTLLLFGATGDLAKRMLLPSLCDEVEAQWRRVDEVRRTWAENDISPRSCGAGGWGPSAAIALTERDGVSWHE